MLASNTSTGSTVALQFAVLRHDAHVSAFTFEGMAALAMSSPCVVRVARRVGEHLIKFFKPPFTHPRPEFLGQQQDVTPTDDTPTPLLFPVRLPALMVRDCAETPDSDNFVKAFERIQIGHVDDQKVGRARNAYTTFAFKESGRPCPFFRAGVRDFFNGCRKPVVLCDYASILVSHFVQAPFLNDVVRAAWVLPALARLAYFTTPKSSHNQSIRSRYARLIMASESDLAGFFETRELKEKGH